MRQVVSIGTDGAISGLQVKPGAGLDLTTLGDADVVRASEVLWDRKAQKWYVEVRRGKLAGKTITTEMIGAAYTHKFQTGAPLMAGLDCTALFDTYENAVAAEIMVLDHLRLTEGAAALQ